MLRTYKMFILYFSIGIITSLTLTALPLIYVDLGMNAKQVTTLISLGFLAVIFQPLIGIATDKWFTSLKMMKSCLLVYSLCSLLIFFFPQYIFFLIIFHTVTRNSILTFIDGYINKYPHLFKFSYATMRSSMPIGAGSAFLIGNIFIFIFGMSVSGMLILLAIMALIAFTIVNSLEDVEIETQGNKNNNSNKSNSTNYVALALLITYFLIYTGSYQINTSYQSLFYTANGFSNAFIGILNLIMIIPQIYLMVSYDRIFKRFKQSSIMLMAASLGITQAVIFILFPTTIFMLIIASMIGGTQIILLAASFYPQITKAVDKRSLATWLTINSTIRAIGAGLFNQTIITNIYQNIGVDQVYVAVSIAMLISFIPVLIYKNKYEA